jgi:multidrug resistance efflux pump
VKSAEATLRQAQQQLSRFESLGKQQRHQPSRRGQRPHAARRRRAALEQAKARSTPATSP